MTPLEKPHNRRALSRRSLVRAALVVGAAAVTGSGTSECGASGIEPSLPPTQRDTPMPDSTERASERRILLAYFSRAGENYDGVLVRDDLPFNLARFVFLDPYAKVFFLDWDTIALDMVGALRTQPAATRPTAA
jgi:hypothetical protein